MSMQPAGRQQSTIDAKPEPVRIDLAKTAIVVVDMQNDFGAKGGFFDRAGIDISMIERAVAPTRKVLDAGRNAGLKIVYLKAGFQPDLSDVGPDHPLNKMKHVSIGVGTEVRAPNGTPSRILIRDTWNTDILPELAPKPGDIVLYKNRFSGFYQTGLDDTLRGLDVKYLVVTGCTTSVCVESTIRDAMYRGYPCILLADCAAEPIGHGLSRSNHDASLLLIQIMFGWISESDAFIRGLAALKIGNADKAA
jgi:ureidoacrylate peracid hydrolase